MQNTVPAPAGVLGAIGDHLTALFLLECQFQGQVHLHGFLLAWGLALEISSPARLEDGAGAPCFPCSLFPGHLPSCKNVGLEENSGASSCP